MTAISFFSQSRILGAYDSAFGAGGLLIRRAGFQVLSLALKGPSTQTVGIQAPETIQSMDFAA